MHQLRSMGLLWDGTILWQSQRHERYQEAFDTLTQQGLTYGCACTRREIADSALRGQGITNDGERPYAGTCRHGLPIGRQARAWRLRVPEGIETFSDRWLGPQEQNVALAVGDFVLRRADGLWAYQLAVVVDDAEQGVTHVVRGADLLSSTARQRVLTRMLDSKPPSVMHVPLVTDPTSGLKLSKQNGAQALDIMQPLAMLTQAWQALGFSPIPTETPQSFLERAVSQWARRFL